MALSRSWVPFSAMLGGILLQWGMLYIFLVPLLSKFGASSLLASYSWYVPTRNVTNAQRGSVRRVSPACTLDFTCRIPSPIVQLFLAPYLSHLSDTLPPFRGWGARLPYLLAAAAVTGTCLLLLPWVPLATGAQPAGGQEGHSSPQWPALVMFVVLAVVLDALSSIQEELCRAMVPDLASPRPCSCSRSSASMAPQQAPRDPCVPCAARKADIARGHGALSVAAGIGNGAGYALGAVPWNTVFGTTVQQRVMSASRGVGPRVLAGLYAAVRLLGRGRGGGACAVRGRMGKGGGDTGRRGGSIHAAVVSNANKAPCTAALLPLSPPESQGGGAAIHSTPPAAFLPRARCWYARGCLRCSAPTGVAAPGAVPLTDAFLWLCCQQLVATAGLWPVWSFASAFFAESVLGGDADASSASLAGRRYTLGVQLAAAALCGMSLVNSLYAWWLPRVLATRASTAKGDAIHDEDIRLLAAAPPSPGASRLYVRGQVVAATALLAGGALCLLWPPGISTGGGRSEGTLHLAPGDVLRCTVAFAGVAASGLCWAGNNVFAYAALPGTLPEQRSDGSNTPLGLYTSLLYMAQTLPQVGTALAVGPLAQYTGAGFGSAVLIAGAAAAAAAGIVQCKLRRTFDAVAVEAGGAALG